MFFTALFYDFKWSPDENEDNIKTRYLNKAWATLRVPLEKYKFEDFNLDRTYKILDNMCNSLKFIKNEFGDQQIKSWKNLWQVGHIAGFILYNQLLDDNNINKINVSEDSNSDFKKILQFCKNDELNDNDYDPLKRLGFIFRLENGYDKIKKQRRNDNFRGGNHFNWVDGLKNAKKYIDM